MRISDWSSDVCSSDLYRSADRRYYRGYRCDSGTGGTILGAIAGGLLGNEVVGRYGDRTAGALVGAGVGALAGRAIDRDCYEKRHLPPPRTITVRPHGLAATSVGFSRAADIDGKSVVWGQRVP